MSYLFADHPAYYTFISNLEEEGEQYKELHAMYAKLSTDLDKEYKSTRKTINSRINPIEPRAKVNKAKILEIPQVKSRSRSRTAKPRKTDAFGNTKYIANDGMWPVRSNSAKRILEPRRLLRYDCRREGELPLLIGENPYLSSGAAKPRKTAKTVTSFKSTSLRKEQNPPDAEQSCKDESGPEHI